MGRRIRAVLRCGSLLGLCLLSAACNDPLFLTPAPTLRGITIPLPPPSFGDAVLLYIDVAGNVPIGYQHPDTQAYLYEKGTGRGYFVGLEDNELTNYTVRDVLVDVDDNCLETWFVDGVDGEPSTTIDYKILLLEGEEACADPGCSAMDEVGMCLCLEKWTVGC